MQTITSANTSIKQIPALHKQAVKENYLRAGEWVLDYGCGKYDLGMDYIHDSTGCVVDGYDKFNREAAHNAGVMSELHLGWYDVILCANVLNVIKEADARAEVIADCAKAGRVALFTTYEGDRTGNGKETSKGWQNNRKTDSYIDELLQHFAVVFKQGSVLIAMPHKEAK